MDSNTKHAEDPAQLQRTDSDVSSDGMDVEVVESDPSGRYSRFSEVLGRGAFKTGECSAQRANLLSAICCMLFT